MHRVPQHLGVLWLLLLMVSFSLKPSTTLAEPSIDTQLARVAPAAGSPGFKQITPQQSGVNFSNVLPERYIPPNQNLMLGSGVAAGDVDNDGWCDLYFTALTRGNALYRNRGGWTFEDHTEVSGTSLSGRTNTGAVFADVNGDGTLDLLVSSLGDGVRLLLNDGKGRFRDVTANAGLAARTGSLSTSLADVDGDHDLDLFVCNYGAQAILKSGIGLNFRFVNGKPELVRPHPERLCIVDGRVAELGEPSALYINDGKGHFTMAEWNSRRFLDEDGKPMAAPWDYSMSAQMRDVNGDGAPDIYVCNDFDTPDRFWINDGRGNFRLAPRRALRLQSYASMGVDFADLDRDGHLDFLVVEMLARDRVRRLTQANPMSMLTRPPDYWRHRPEVTRNTLFRGRADGTFDEIAHFAGLAASDWSWQGSFVDIDLDGYEDLLVVNGHWFDVQDMDVPPPRSSTTEDRHAQLLATPHLFTPNVAWRNRGNLTFEDRSVAWNFADTNIAHGLALADLDNDGDLDAIANCLNAPALLLRNEADNPRVAVHLRGRAPNTQGIGARVTLRGGPVPFQSQEILAGGKYLSGDEPMRVFAASSSAMELEIQWRSGARTIVSNVQPNSVLRIHENAEPVARTSTKATPALLFSDHSANLNHVHSEPEFDDLQIQPSLTRKLSQRGPGICVTDLNGDSFDDLVIGAGRNGRITFHRGDGRGGFTLAASSEPVPDDVHSLVPWISAAGQPAVLCTLARHESSSAHPSLLMLRLDQQELTFHTLAAPGSLPEARSVGHTLALADYDRDGDLDVFLGSHAKAGRYPEAAPSVLLKNDGGLLRADAELPAALQRPGLVNSALWSDLDNDGWPDLLLACEWGSIRVFKNTEGRLTPWNPPVACADVPRTSMDSWTGWWTGLAAADFDNDGRMDFAAGNWGLNGAERSTHAKPLRLLCADTLGRGYVDLFEAEESSAGLMPNRSLSEMAALVPVLAPQFKSHRTWAQTPLRTSLASLGSFTEHSASHLAHTVFLNRGEHFEARPLPSAAQWAPAFAVLAEDLDGDGYDDIFLGQNFSASASGTAPLNAGHGLLLRGDGTGTFRPHTESGIDIAGDQRGAVSGDFNQDGRPDLVVSQNSQSTRLLLNKSGTASTRVRLVGPERNPSGIGARLTLSANGGRLKTREISGGSGWLSHQSTTVILPQPQTSNAVVEVHWPNGQHTRTLVPPHAATMEIKSR